MPESAAPSVTDDLALIEGMSQFEMNDQIEPRLYITMLPVKPGEQAVIHVHKYLRQDWYDLSKFYRQLYKMETKLGYTEDITHTIGIGLKIKLGPDDGWSDQQIIDKIMETPSYRAWYSRDLIGYGRNVLKESTPLIIRHDPIEVPVSGDQRPCIYL